MGTHWNDDGASAERSDWYESERARGASYEPDASQRDEGASWESATLPAGTRIDGVSYDAISIVRASHPPTFTLPPKPAPVIDPPPLRIACPSCTAREGHHCQSKSGQPIRAYHRARKEAAAPSAADYPLQAEARAKRAAARHAEDAASITAQFPQTAQASKTENVCHAETNTGAATTPAPAQANTPAPATAQAAAIAEAAQVEAAFKRAITQLVEQHGCGAVIDAAWEASHARFEQGHQRRRQ